MPNLASSPLPPLPRRPRGAHPTGRLVLLAGLVGVVGGLGALLFDRMGRAVADLALVGVAGYDQGGPAGATDPVAHSVGSFSPLLLLLVLAAGALLSGLLVFLLAPEAEGHGTDAVIHAYHQRHGLVRARVPLVKMVASALTLGTGGSGGREGPIAQIGAGFGSVLATRLGLSNRERRILLLAGVGAGIAAIFRAPVAGAVFAAEVLYVEADFEPEALVPSFLASAVAYCVFALFGSFSPLFALSPMGFDDPLLLVPCTALALVLAVFGRVYVRTFYGVRDLFRVLPVPRPVRPVIGALATGLVALLGWWGTGRLGGGPSAQTDALAVLSAGYGFLQRALDGGLAGGSGAVLALLLFVAVGKILTTSLTIGSGGSAGVFGPSMVIGGSLGAAVGILTRDVLPSLTAPVDMFVVLGMAGFFASVANTPLSSFLIVAEMTAGYALLPPAMWVCAVAYLLGRGPGIYREQVPTRADSPAHRGDFLLDVLRGATVREVLPARARTFVVVPRDLPLAEVRRRIPETEQATFPVVAPDGRWVGTFTLADVRRYLYETEVAPLTVALDLAGTAVRPLTLDTDLSAAMGAFAATDADELPVVETARPEQVVALLRRADLMAAHEARLRAARTESGALPGPA